MVRTTNVPLLLFTCLLLALHFTGCSRQEAEKPEPVRPVKAFKVGDPGELTGRSFPGRARAHNEVDLSFRVQGQLMVLPNDVIGREYEEGGVIARLDPRDYEVAIRDVEGKLERARANERRAQTLYDRELNIFREDPGATSKSTVDNKLAARDQAAAEVKSLEASLDSAKDNLEYTYLRAPFGGKVVARYVDNFQDVRAKEKVVRLLDNSHIEMVVNIPETMISNLPYVENIKVTFDAFPDQPVAAEIHEVGTEASFATRTYPVTLIMDQPDDFTILAGMAGRARGTARLPGARADVGIHVPVGAVFTPETENANFVWVIDETSGSVSRRSVKTGSLVSHGILITQGLKPGEWVATAGVHTLREGQKVKIMQEGGSPE